MMTSSCAASEAASRRSRSRSSRAKKKNKICADPADRSVMGENAYFGKARHVEVERHADLLRPFSRAIRNKILPWNDTLPALTVCMCESFYFSKWKIKIEGTNKKCPSRHPFCPSSNLNRLLMVGGSGKGLPITHELVQFSPRTARRCCAPVVRVLWCCSIAAAGQDAVLGG